MLKKYKLSLFIFRRDLRLSDNTGLIAALRASECVIPCFIFDKRQIEENTYFSKNAFSFMLDSLTDLDNQLRKNNGRLYFFEGIAETVVDKMLSHLPIEAVFFNRDYTPFSTKRDAAIKQVALQQKRDCVIENDALLHEPEDIFKIDRHPYTVYTPFMRKAKTLPVLAPVAFRAQHFYDAKIPSALHNFEKIKNKYYIKQSYPGGRSEGKKLLKALTLLKDYEKKRDFPALNATTHLSAHHKFGTVSIRETYAAIAKSQGVDSVLINELYWRDFFTHIAFHFPYVFEGPFHQKYRKIPWENNKTWFKKWCEGETGFPIVDAGMRELNATGFMHNRVRMITASFLVKDLHINWQWGERYFAQQLVDYDPAVNNGNWQWAASTGCDAQPYFRVFNPALQQKKFDPEGRYIQTWVPDVEKNPLKPMVDHAVQAAKIKTYYRNG